MKWQIALALHRVVCFAAQVRATHTCRVDLACASHGALGTASKWKVYVGDALWRGFQTLAAKRVSQKRNGEGRTAVRAMERGLPWYHGATNVTSMQDILDYLKRLGKDSSLMGMCQR